MSPSISSETLAVSPSLSARTRERAAFGAGAANAGGGGAAELLLPALVPLGAVERLFVAAAAGLVTLAGKSVAVDDDGSDGAPAAGGSTRVRFRDMI